MAMTLRADKGAILSWNEMDANFRACLGVHNLLHVRDKKIATADGGPFTSGAWRTRVLNDVVLNNIAGASLESDIVTLPAGNYYAQGYAPAYFVNLHAMRLYNITGSVELLMSTLVYASNTENIETSTLLSGYFALPVQSLIALQHRCQTSNTSFAGFGWAADFGQGYSIFADLKIWKLS